MQGPQEALPGPLRAGMQDTQSLGSSFEGKALPPPPPLCGLEQFPSTFWGSGRGLRSMVQRTASRHYPGASVSPSTKWVGLLRHPF